MNLDEHPIEEQTLMEDIKMFLGGVATLTMIIVPIILIRKLTKTIEEGDLFKRIEEKLS